MSNGTLTRFAFVVSALALFVLSPLLSTASSNVSAAAGRNEPTFAPIVAAAKAACSQAEYDTRRAALESARGGWISHLSPDAYEKFNAARNVYLKYLTRCAKKLGIDVQAATGGILAYSYTDVAAKNGAPKTSPAQQLGSGIFFDGTPGTSAPPGTLGVYTMTPFPDDPRAQYTDADGVNSPFGGALEFGDTTTVLTAGGGWSTWSHGYTGDVYFVDADTLTLYMPPNTHAFYFYAEANSLDPFDFTATANDGTSSYPVTIDTDAGGAKYFGFHTSTDRNIVSITVECSDACTDSSFNSGFAVGEFGIFQNSGADLRVLKYSEPHNTIKAGEIFTYTIFVDNLGPDIASNVVVSDTLLNSAAISIQSCAFSVSQGGGVISQFTCTTGNVVSTQFGTDIGTFATNELDPLSPQSQGRLRASFRMVANEAMNLTNTTRVSSNTFDPNLNNNFAQDEIAVVPLAADLSLLKYSEPHNTVKAGDIFTYTIYVDNLGPDIASNVVVSDTLLNSAAISIQSCAFSVSQGGGVVSQFTCTTGDLVSTQFGTDIATFATDKLDPLSPQSQGRLRASFRMVANEAMDVTNTTRVTSNTFDPNLNNNFAQDEITVTPLAADLNLLKYSEPHNTVKAGDIFTYTIYVDNLGPDIASNVIVSDTLLNSAQVSIQSCAFSVSQGGGVISQFTCTTGDVVSTQFGTDIGTFGTNSLDPLSPSTPGRLRASFLLVANEAMDVTNTTRVTSNTFDPNLNNNFAQDQITVVPVANLVLTKSAPSTAGAGEMITYDLTVTNNGPSPAKSVQVLDYLPAQFKLASVTTAQGSCAAGVEGDPLQPTTCDVGTLAPGDVVNIQIAGQVRSDTLGETWLFNDAQVSSAILDVTMGDNIDSVSTAISATCGVKPAKPLVNSPPNNKKTKAPAVLLDWTDSNCATRYRVVVRQDSVAKPNFLTAETGIDSQYLTPPLPAGHWYYWRGVSCNGTACSVTSWSRFKVKFP